MPKYHRLIFKCGAKVTLFEPKKNNYFWVELYLKKKSRGTGLSEKIINSTLAAFPGSHQFHFNPIINSLRKLAIKLKWIKLGKSNYIEDCIAYKYKSSRKHQTDTTELFSHKVMSRCPNLVAYYSKKDIREILITIKSNY